MRTILKALATLAVACSSLAVQAHGFRIASIAIGHPYARATVPGQPSGGGYLKLDNQGTTDDRLVGARAAVAERVELHSMSMEGDVMRMRRVDAVDVPAGRAVELKPGGLHLMLLGLKAPLKAGERFPLTLAFEKAGEVEVVVNVEAPGGDRAAASASHGPGHHH